MSIIGWILLGLIAGFVASKIVNKAGEVRVGQLSGRERQQVPAVGLSLRALLACISAGSAIRSGGSAQSWVSAYPSRPWTNRALVGPGFLNSA